MKRLFFICILLLIPVMVSFAQETTEERQKRIEEKQDEILKEIDRLKNQTGVLIDGRIKFDFEIIKVSGKSLATNVATRELKPFIQVDFNIEASPLEGIRGGGKIRLENNMSGFWGGGDVISAREVWLKALLIKFIEFKIGDIREKLTPFTLWAPVWELKYDAKLFLLAGEDAKYDNFLDEENKWPLQGIHMDLGFKSTYLVDKVYLKGFVSRLDTDPYDRLISGARISTLSKGEVGILEFGGTITGLNDIKTTEKAESTPLESYVISGDWNLRPVKSISIFGEIAQSKMDFYTGIQSTAAQHTYKDTAAQGGAQIHLFGISLKGMYHQVGYDYFAPGAQTAAYNIEDPSSYLQIQSLETIFDERTYNKIVRVTRDWYNVMNPCLPMNIATPNREGYIIGVDTVSPGFVETEVKYYQLKEIKSIMCRNELRNFEIMEGGGRINLRELFSKKSMLFSCIPVIIGSYKAENIKRDDDVGTTNINEKENYKIELISGGLEFYPLNKLSFLFGYNLLKHKGRFWTTTFPSATDLNPLTDDIANLLRDLDGIQTIIGLGLYYSVSPNAGARIDYQMKKLHNKKNDYKYNLDIFHIYYLIKF